MPAKDLSIDHALEALESSIEQKKMELKEKSEKVNHSPLRAVLDIQTFAGLYSLEKIIEKAHETRDSVLETFQEEINESPWRFLSKIGLIGLGVGLMIGTRIQDKRKTT
jgi:hypothetical protein